MIEDKRRTHATDFDDHDCKQAHEILSPRDTGAMLGDDDLDRLCDAALTDLGVTDEPTSRE